MNRRIVWFAALSVSTLPLVCAAQAGAIAPDAVRTPPAPHCLDARNVQQMEQAQAAAIAVRDQQGRAFRISFTAQCPGILDADSVRLEAPEGWACGRPTERVVVDGVACAVAAVDVIDNREFSQTARQSDRQYAATLPTVTVSRKEASQAPRHTFQSSPEYCFATRNVRSWNEDPQSVIVETNPRRNGGHRYYRVELGGSCSILAGAHEVDFQSGFQNGLICGNPGDRIVMAASGIVGDGRSHTPRFARPGCPILAVYPKESRANE